MTRVVRLPFVACLVMPLNITPSWGGPSNPPNSDANFNTAGGSGGARQPEHGFLGGCLQHGVRLLCPQGKAAYHYVLGCPVIIGEVAASR
jgi:hypothetical protein